MKSISIAVYSLTLLISLQVMGASPYKQSLTQKSNAYADNGVFTGGRAGAVQSLMKVRRVSSTKVGIERVIMDLGDGSAKPVVQAGYFHVSVDKKNARVVVQLSQLGQTMISEKSMRKMFSKSAYVKAVDFSMDPEDSTGLIVLHLKKAVKAEVFELPGKKKKTARLVLDFLPAGKM